MLTKIKKVFNSYLGEKKFGVHLALISSIGIATIVILLSLFYLDLTSKLDLSHKLDKEFLKRTITDIVINDNNKLMAKGQYQNFEDVATKLKNKNLVEQVSFFKKDNPNIIWSTNENLIKNKITLQKYMKAAGNNENTILVNTDTNIIFITFPKTGDLNITKFLNISKFAVLIVLIISLITIAIFAEKVVSPLKNLSQQAEFISKGNFDNFIPRTGYREMNQLVTSLNIMSYELKKIYMSLEEKVKQRTQELDTKNKELEKVYTELKDTQSMMVHSEKMRSLGEMVSGITHEINNPVNFIHGNLVHLKNYSHDLIEIIDKMKEYTEKLPEQDKEEISALLEELDYEYLKEDLPKLIGSCQEGTERTRNIVMDLKNFSRMEEMLISEINVEKELQTALNILHNKYKNVIEIHEEFSHVPNIEAYGGQLNQVFVNILDNALGAIKEVKKTGNIYIRTKQDGQNVIIEIQDDGKGMTDEQKEKIFEPFFTTKPIGSGTGLGMSISYKVISTHNGKIDVKSKLNEGTTISLTLPIKMEKKPEKKQA